MEPEWKYLTKKDEATIHGIAKRHLPPLAQYPTTPLYHYTSGENLIRIIESDELWSTQIACLNDTAEVRYGLGELQKRVHQKRAMTQESELEPLWQQIDKFLADPQLETAGVFVACFSELNDDLSQWRAYSGGEGGYAIRFDHIRLRQGSGGFASPLLLRVEYDLQRQRIICDDIISQAERYYVECEGRQRAQSPQHWAEEFVRFYLWLIEILLVCLKHPAFAGEQEWRLVNYWRPADQTQMRFRQRRSTMSRHLPIQFSGGLPISGVTVGPCRYPLLSKIAVSDLLQNHGYTSAVKNVELSGVPYRVV